MHKSRILHHQTADKTRLFWCGFPVQNEGMIYGYSLGDVWADTTTPHGRLLLTVLGGLAEFERELILVRTGEGRARAKARGVKMGRKPKLTPHQRSEALARTEAGEAMCDIARSYNVAHTTISRPLTNR